MVPLCVCVCVCVFTFLMDAPPRRSLPELEYLLWQEGGSYHHCLLLL